MAARRTHPPGPARAKATSDTGPLSDRWSERPMEHEVVRVVVVALDGPTETFVRQAAAQDPRFAVETVPDMLSARVAIESKERRTVVIVEAVHLRKMLVFPPYVHVIALAGPDRNSPRPLGIDDIVRRPLDFDDLRLRLRLASRALARGYQVSPIEVLRQLMAAGKSGELVIGRGDDLARIHLESGRLAWVHRPRHAVSMRTLFAPTGLNISDETSRDIVDESRSSRRHFADVLVDWGLVERAAVRESLLGHVRSELDAILEWTDTTTSFVEKEWAFTSSFAFSEHELMTRLVRTSRIQTRPGMAAVVLTDEPAVDGGLVTLWLDRVAAVEHVLGCALLDTKNGAVIGSRGALERDTNVAWELAGGFSALGSDGEELVATTRTCAYLVRSASELGAVAVVSFAPNHLSPAMARILIAKAAAGRELTER